jgi:transcription antitermination factor NusG
MIDVNSEARCILEGGGEKYVKYRNFACVDGSPVADFRVGDKVKVTYGKLKDKIGIITDLSEHGYYLKGDNGKPLKSEVFAHQLERV